MTKKEEEEEEGLFPFLSEVDEDNIDNALQKLCCHLVQVHAEVFPSVSSL